MANVKSIYLRLKEQDLIAEEKYTRKPRRDREKAMGFMWDGEMEVLTKEGLRFRFHMWKHFHDDDGENWYPSQEELDKAWSTKFVPKTRNSSADLCDAYWYTIYEGDHIYVSSKGWFDGGDKVKEDIVASIKDGTWVNNPDVWMLM